MGPGPGLTPGRRCHSCGCVLASDNPLSRCSPCARRDRPAPGPAPTIALPDLHAAWSLGFDSFRATTGADVATAARLARRLGLVPATWKLTEDRLVELATDRRSGSAALARRWGISRWTVAAWRCALRLERQPSARRRPATGPPDPLPDLRVGVVDGVAAASGADGPIRLGRAATRLLVALVTHHPGAAPVAALAAALYPEVPAPRGAAAVHTAVCRLRRAIGDGAVVRARDGYRLAVLPDADPRAPYVRSRQVGDRPPPSGPVRPPIQRGTPVPHDRPGDPAATAR